MKLGAFGIYKNIIRWDYPAIESIKSILDAVDSFTCNIGVSEDKTKELMYDTFSTNKKVILFEEEWEDKALGTTFFSSQTNKALDKVQEPWAMYLQADEVIHENDLLKITQSVKELEKRNLQGATFNYLHFADSPTKIKKTYKDGFDFYDTELRIIKNDNSLISFGDGQSFSFINGGYFDPRGPQPALHQKEKFLETDINVYHYSYLRDKKKLLEKKKYLEEFYKISEPSRQESIIETDGQYFIDPQTLKEFKNSHPKIMHSRLGI